MPIVDAARGAALLAMIAYHLVWDLGHFAIIPESIPRRADFIAFGDGIAATFLFLAGVSLALAARRADVGRAFWRRLGILLLAAIAVSLATFVAFPEAFVFFGVLHCIALAGLLAWPMRSAPAWSVGLVAVLILTAPLLVASPAFDRPWLMWTGLGTIEPMTNDWRPFFPFAGILLTGLAAGRLRFTQRLQRRLSSIPLAGWSGRALRFGGRHSLAIYLIHQPFLYGALFGLVALFGAYPPTEEGAFLRACETRCRGQSEAAYCRRVCGCVASRAKILPLWRSVMANRLEPAESALFDEIARACVRETSG